MYVKQCKISLNIQYTNQQDRHVCLYEGNTPEQKRYLPQKLLHPTQFTTIYLQFITIYEFTSHPSPLFRWVQNDATWDINREKQRQLQKKIAKRKRTLRVRCLKILQKETTKTHLSKFEKMTPKFKSYIFDQNKYQNHTTHVYT